MSLAPASSRGAFLNARLAVNGIQCAARSLGTLTAGESGLLSSIGASSRFLKVWWVVPGKLPASSRDGNADARLFLPQSGGFRTGRGPGLPLRFPCRSAAAIQNTSPEE